MQEFKKTELKTLIMLLVMGGIIYFFISIRGVLLPFVAAVILAYLFYPLICFLHSKNIPRTWSIYIITIIFLMLISIFIFFIFPGFLKEIDELIVMIPNYINQIDNYIDYLNREYRRVQLPAIFKEVIDRTLLKLEDQTILFLEGITETIINSLSTLCSLFIAPFITYYFLRDLDKLKKNSIRYIPLKVRKTTCIIINEINKVFVGYIRGQIWVSIIVGILSGIGLFFFRIRFYLILAIFTGFTNMIPYIGPIIGGIPAVFIAFLSSPMKALGIIILFMAIQQIESIIIAPKIMSEEVGLHPVSIIFALLVGAELFGIWGLLLAVPIAGSIKVIINFVYEFFINNKELDNDTRW